ncbi:MAG: Crp/Fnr family transcriptional regulator, partial [Thermodesulfobacteriota bacterium]
AMDSGFRSLPESSINRGLHCVCKDGNEAEVIKLIKDMGESIPIFSFLGDSERCAIAPLFDMFRLPEGAVFSSICFPEDFIAIVASGKIVLKTPSIFKGRQTPLALLSRGAHFESFCLLDNRPLSVIVSTLSETVLLMISREKLYGLMREHPFAALKLLKGIAGVLEIRLQNAQRRVAGFY